MNGTTIRAPSGSNWRVSVGSGEQVVRVAEGSNEAYSTPQQQLSTSRLFVHAASLAMVRLFILKLTALSVGLVRQVSWPVLSGALSTSQFMKTDSHENRGRTFALLHSFSFPFTNLRPPAPSNIHLEPHLWSNRQSPGCVVRPLLELRWRRHRERCWTCCWRRVRGRHLLDVVGTCGGIVDNVGRQQGRRGCRWTGRGQRWMSQASWVLLDVADVVRGCGVVDDVDAGWTSRASCEGVVDVRGRRWTQMSCADVVRGGGRWTGRGRRGRRWTCEGVRARTSLDVMRGVGDARGRCGCRWTARGRRWTSRTCEGVMGVGGRRWT